MKNLRKVLEQIAQREFGIKTLETQSSDQLDFHEVSVGSLRSALAAAYALGQQHAKNQ